mmetsp:Transcript_2143/g.6606  ORF Transcript_2143/g.6606 Transcript_2143/m.6606 type:complete len:221 (-) Transcript_2143:417-1079(-)
MVGLPLASRLVGGARVCPLRRIAGCGGATALRTAAGSCPAGGLHRGGDRQPAARSVAGRDGDLEDEVPPADRGWEGLPGMHPVRHLHPELLLLLRRRLRFAPLARLLAVLLIAVAVRADDLAALVRQDGDLAAVLEPHAVRRNLPRGHVVRAVQHLHHRARRPPLPLLCVEVCGAALDGVAGLEAERARLPRQVLWRGEAVVEGARQELLVEPLADEDHL